MVRSATMLPGQVYSGETPIVDPNTGHTSEDVIQRVQDLAGIVGGGSMPAAAKGALGMAGGRMMQPTAEVPVFHSAVEHALANAPQDKATPQQWTGWLKNQPGVKQEEMDWLGLNDPAALPAGPKGLVSKQDLLAHAQGHGPQIKEVEKNGRVLDEESIGDRAAEIMERDHPDLTPEHAEYYGHYDEATSQADYELRGGEHGEFGAGAPKFSDYQLPGGDNYRELLLTLPNQGKKYLLDGLNDKGDVVVKNRHTGEIMHEGTPESARSYLQETNATSPQVFSGSHWDEPNVLVHMRMNDRILDAAPISGIEAKITKAYPNDAPQHMGSGMPQKAIRDGVLTPQEAADWSRSKGWLSGYEDKPGTGLKSLHLEEVQSDWHQKGRKEGYKGQNPTDSAVQYEQQLNKLGYEFGSGRQLYKNGKHVAEQDAPPEVRELFSKVKEASSRDYDAATAVPDAPFKTTWADLALKRAIAKAAREGYDAISWTPGEQQAARYDLSKQVDAIEAHNLGDGHYFISGKKPGSNSFTTLKQRIPADKLPDVVGKDLADKIIKQNEQVKEYSGVDLKVGGEGMKAFYDKMLVDKANAIGKRFGAKVEWKEIRNPNHNIPDDVWNGGTDAYRAQIERGLGEPRNYRIPVLRLNDKLKDAATNKGFPLFAHGLPYSFTPVDGNPFEQKQEQSP